MYCPHCGKKIPADSEFCHYCGYKIVKNKQKPLTTNASNFDNKKEYHKQFNDKFKNLTVGKRILFILSYIVEILLPIIASIFGSGACLVMTVLSFILVVYFPYFIEHRDLEDDNNNNKADLCIYTYLIIVFLGCLVLII